MERLILSFSGRGADVARELARRLVESGVPSAYHSQESSGKRPRQVVRGSISDLIGTTDWNTAIEAAVNTGLVAAVVSTAAGLFQRQTRWDITVTNALGETMKFSSRGKPTKVIEEQIKNFLSRGEPPSRRSQQPRGKRSR